MKRLNFVLFLALFLSINSYGNSCGNYLLFEKKSLSSDDIASIEADASTVENKNIFKFSGNASLISSKYALNADNISFNKIAKTSSSNSNVQFNDENTLLKADSAVISQINNEDHIRAYNAEYSIPDKKIRGYASFLSGTSNKKLFKDATYTKCPKDNISWTLDADLVTLDSSSNKGNARNAILKFHDFPIFFHPSYEWVLSGKGTGFLTPSFSSYSDDTSKKKGYSLNVPYFLNIAPDRDLLFNLNHLSTRGESFEAKYRQLIYDGKYWKKGRMETDIRFLEEDKITNKKRWFLDNKIRLSINKNSDLEIVNNRVSDINYLKEISLNDNNVERLYSTLKFNNDNKFFNTKIYSEREQVVNSGNPSYTKDLEINLSKNLKFSKNEDILKDISIELGTTTTSFSHKNQQNESVLRNHLESKFTKTIKDLGYEITPSVTIQNTNYYSDSEDADRTIYSFNINSKLFLERELNFNDVNLIQTLRPRLVYNYTPKKAQNLITLLDTESNDSNSYESLFAINNFYGSDRISNQNNFILGVESDFINDDDGDTIIGLKAAQKFYIEDEVMNSSGNFVKTNDSNRGYSNVETIFEYNASPLTFSTNLSLDPDKIEVDKSISTIKVDFSSKNFLNMQYVDENNEENLLFNGVYQFSESKHFLWNINRNLTYSNNNKLTLGVVNEDCCTAYRFVYFKENDNINRAFEFVFKGLTTTSPSLRKKIESEIPNYLGDLNTL